MAASSIGSLARPDQRRYLKLLPLSEAYGKVLSELRGCHCGVEVVPVERSLGRVAAENILADREIPPKALAAMDGYAASIEDIRKANLSNPVSLNVSGRLRPADFIKSSRASVRRHHAYYVATGAPIPRGTDVVVRVEDTKLVGPRTVQVFRSFEAGKNISPAGEDVSKGSKVVEAHDVINASQIALMIACEVASIRVFKRPRAGVLSVGNELMEFRGGRANSRSPTKVYNNYSNLVRGYLEQAGIETVSLGVCPDDWSKISKRLRESLRSVDAICTIGGSSVGVADLTPDAAGSLAGAERLFHGVRVVPIRPAGMVVVNQRGMKKPIVIIPGHSVSAALTTFVLALPVLNLLSGLGLDSRRSAVRAVAESDFKNERAIDALMLVRLRRSKDGRIVAVPLGWGSNLLSNLCRAQGFVHLKPSESIRAEDELQVELMGPSELLRISSS